MSAIKVHVLQTGSVCVSPDLPFGGDHVSLIQASGVFEKKSNRLWLPVSVYLIETDHGYVLFDCGWHRNMSPEGIFDRHAQIKSLGSLALYETNQGLVPEGQAVDEQLSAMGIAASDLALVLLSHLDCDHVNGLKLVADAQKILVSEREMESATARKLVAHVRFNPEWWEGTKIQTFEWNGTEGPFRRSYDVFGDGSLVLINIPGHTDGLCALKIRNSESKFVLLFADGGYAKKSWEELIVPGIAVNREEQKTSLEWIREQSLDPDCIESLATHDPDVKPHIIEL